MAAKEEVELNMNAEQVRKLENEERATLKEEFKKVFSKHNEFQIPLETAWHKFERIMDSRSEIILPTDTDKILSLCVTVRKEYFEKDRGIIVDRNGNPDIQANLEENPKFLEEHPEYKAVVENKISPNKYNEIVDSKDPVSFWNGYKNLNEEEKKSFREQYIKDWIDKNSDKIKEEEQEIRDKIVAGEEIDEKKAAKIQAEKELKTIFDEKAETDQTEYTLKQKKGILRSVSVYLLSPEIKDQQNLMMILQGVMSEEEIELFNTNKGEFLNRFLGYVNSFENGSYQSIDEFIEASRKELVEQFKERNIEFSKENLEESLEGYLEQSKRMKIKKTNFEERFTSKLELDFFDDIRNIDFSKNENVLMFIKLYKDISNEKRFIGDKQKQAKVDAIKKVAEEVIFAPENAGLFGDYLNTNQDGSVVINQEKFNKDSESIVEDYSRNSFGFN